MEVSVYQGYHLFYILAGELNNCFSAYHIYHNMLPFCPHFPSQYCMFSFAKAFLIQVLYSVGVIKGFGDWDAAMVADGLPSFLICIEMLGFAVMHLHAFPHTDYLHYLQRHEGHSTTMEVGPY